MTKPGVQKPHCEAWQSTIARCTGCSASSSCRAPPARPRSSTVTSALPSSAGRNWMQALVVVRRRPPTISGASVAEASASSPTTTVQAPQSPSLQPSLLPVQRASSRSHSRTVRVGAALPTSTTAPRWKKRIGRLAMTLRWYTAIRMPHPESAPAAPRSAAGLAVRGDLLDFSAEPAWGETESAAVRFRPNHWLLVEGGRIAGVQAEAPGEGWERHDYAGRLVLPGFIDTHVH